MAESRKNGILILISDKMEKYGLSDYLAIKQKYFEQYQASLAEEK